MKIDVSVGEAVDKYSILEIKKDKIKDPNKLIEIEKELGLLKECKTYIDRYKLFYKFLLHVNTIIWDETEKAFNSTITLETYDKIFNLNKKRYRLKRYFNTLSGSEIKEQKSNRATCCLINIDSSETFYKKLKEINYLSIEYDYIFFVGPTSLFPDILRLFGDRNIGQLEVYDTIHLKDQEVESTWDFEPVSYLSGGMMGDFINQLSVVNENFLKTGRKGIVYVSDSGDKFRFGVERAFDDTYNFVSSQVYIIDYRIHNGEKVDVDLTIWRKSPLLCCKNLYEIFKDTYRVEWATHRWLVLPKLEEYKNKVLISTNSYRYCPFIDFRKLTSKLDCLYIADEKSYEHFLEKTSSFCDQVKTVLSVHHKFLDLEETALAINSCRLFVGNLSAPLTMAFACRTPCLIGLPDDPYTYMNSGYTFMDEIYYSVDQYLMRNNL